ncbi:MAG: alkaline phosphatase family protein [Candidatus Limnocylindrales bacterium]
MHLTAGPRASLAFLATAVLVTGFLTAGCAAPAATSPATAAATSAPSAAMPAPAGGLPAFSHVYLIVLENHGLASILGSPDAPYLHSLISDYGLATDYRAVAHPSQPNYLALFSGSTQGVTDDGVHDIAAPTVVDQLEAAGRSWRVYAQNVPGGCYRGASASGGEDGPGTYARKHEPAISFTGISRNPARCADIADFTHFDPAAAAYELIIPNMCNDMHDCSVAEGDRFLAGFVPRILASQAWRQGGVLFITWDEGSGPEPVATLVVARGVRAGFRSAVPHDHYSLLRTIEAAWQLPCLGNACHANVLSEFFPGTATP